MKAGTRLALRHPLTALGAGGFGEVWESEAPGGVRVACKIILRLLDPAGMIWVSWPKKSSKVPTDITEDVIREICLPMGLVDVKVCAVDATWSGLKLVVRRQNRDVRPQPAGPA